ncbi:MAG: lipocalin family protein [Candidatus Sericytochromatia bacterium]
MKKTLQTFACFCLTLGLQFGLVVSPVQAQNEPLQTVENVDLSLYLGLWFEIASISAPFQSPDCVGTTATYTRNADTSIKVWNQCYLPKENRLERIEGRATVVEASNQAKLKVSFFGPFAGDYWVIDLDSNYSYAVVGHPSRNYLWILSRTPEMDSEQYSAILSRIQAKGYDLKRIKRTAQWSKSL